MKPFDKICLVREVSGLSATQKLLLLTIATHLGENDFCFLSITTLQKECCVAKRHTITDNLKVLIDLGYIIRLHPRPGFKSNQYQINFEKIQEKLSTDQSFKGTSKKGELVLLRDQGSPSKGLDQSFTGTRVVLLKDPKIYINKYKNNIKGKNFFVSVDNFEKRSESQRQCGIENLRTILTNLGVKKH